MTTARPTATNGTDKPSGPRSRKGIETRARLVDAAKEVFERDGFLDARISDIAEKAGLSHGSFYHYFESKEEVFREVAADVEARLQRADEQRDPGPVVAPGPAERIREAIRLHLESYRDEARIMGVIEQVSRFDPEIMAQRAESHRVEPRRGGQLHPQPPAPRPGRCPARSRHCRRRARLHDLPLPRDVVRPGPARLRLRSRRRAVDVALRPRPRARGRRGTAGRAPRRRPPPAEPMRAQPSVAACHSSSCGASRGQRANRPSSRGPPGARSTRGPPTAARPAGPGAAARPAASEVARVWWGSLAPLRNTRAGRSMLPRLGIGQARARARRRGGSRPASSAPWWR